MKIYVTRGVYGFRQNGSVVEKTSSSAPFDVDDEEGKRLIMLKVAREAGLGGSRNREYDPEGNEDNGTDNPPEYAPEDSLEEMPFSELRKMAKELGVNGKGSREELIERLRQYVAGEGEDEEEELDEEDVPKLTVEEPE